MFFYTWDLNCDWFSFAVNIFDSEWLFEVIVQYPFGSTHSGLFRLSAMLILFNFNVYYFLFYCRSSISYRCRQVFHATLIKTKITWWCLPNSPQKFKNSANIKGQWAGAIVGAPVIVIKIFPLRTIASRTADKPLSGLRGLGLHPDWKGAVIIN